jgi:hypothetical protein
MTQLTEQDFDSFCEAVLLGVAKRIHGRIDTQEAEEIARIVRHQSRKMLSGDDAYKDILLAVSQKAITPNRAVRVLIEHCATLANNYLTARRN